MLKENILIWKVGKLEDVIEKVAKKKLDVEKKRIQKSYMTR